MRLEGLGSKEADDRGALPEGGDQRGDRRRRERRGRRPAEGRPAGRSHLGIVVLRAPEEEKNAGIEGTPEARQGLDGRGLHPGRWIGQSRHEPRRRVGRGDRTAPRQCIEGDHADVLVPIAEGLDQGGDHSPEIDRRGRTSRDGEVHQRVNRGDPDGRLAILQGPDQPRGRDPGQLSGGSGLGRGGADDAQGLGRRGADLGRRVPQRRDQRGSRQAGVAHARLPQLEGRAGPDGRLGGSEPPGGGDRRMLALPQVTRRPHDEPAAGDGYDQAPDACLHPAGHPGPGPSLGRLDVRLLRSLAAHEPSPWIKDQLASAPGSIPGPSVPDYDIPQPR